MSQLQLLSKVTVGGQELQNRVVLAAMTRARCAVTDSPLDLAATIPNELMAEYYEQRGSSGLILTEATAVSEDGSGWANAPHIREKEHVEGWKTVVDRVHAKGSKIYLQLWHMGRQTHSSFHPTTKRIVSSSNEKMTEEKPDIHGVKQPPEVPHSLTIEEIQETVKDFANAAVLAKEAGFDGVQVHGANGYLIDQFLQSHTNKRTDIYGGSNENRCRILLEIIDAILATGAYPEERIGVKLSPNGVFGEMGSEDNFELFTDLAKNLNKYKLAFVELMDGLGFGFHGKGKGVTCMDIKKYFDGPIIANVGLTRDTAEGLIRSGAADLASFGRPYISNPDLVERFTNDWPLAADADYMDWWHKKGAGGYTDFSVYTAP